MLKKELGAVHKRRPHKIAKNWLSLPSCPQNVRTGLSPLLSVRTHHKFRKIRSFCAKKCGRPKIPRNPSPLVRKMSALGKLPSPDFGHLLWMVSFKVYVKHFCFRAVRVFKIRPHKNDLCLSEKFPYCLNPLPPCQWRQTIIF